MYKIKETPEDFIVKEISDIKTGDSGEYAICLLKKTNYTTIRAIEEIARRINKGIKDIGFAGTKDKKAVTEQNISIKRINKEKIESLNLKDIELKFLGYLDKPISMGILKGNEFIITIKELTGEQIKSIEKKANFLMPNFFGEQRFSKNNAEIGKLLFSKKFKEAIDLIIDSNSDYNEKIKEFLEKNQNNFTSALQIIPKRLLLMYIHAYQSLLWNRTLESYMKKNRGNTRIPIIGFGTEIENEEIGGIITKIMQEEKITFRSFINKSFPMLSSEGDSRDAFTEIKDFKILEKEKEIIKINFKLNKGCYATEAIKFILK